jgi:hypothetical protein
MRRALFAVLSLIVACGGASTDEAVPPPRSVPPPTSSIPAVLSPEGFGVVHIGMTVAGAGRALGESLSASGDPECSWIDPAGLPVGVSLMVVQDTVVRIDVTEGDAQAAEGIRIGAGAAAVEAAYPGRVETQPHKYTDGRYLIVAAGDTLNRLVFETDGAAVTRFRAGRLPYVQWVEGCS